MKESDVITLMRKNLKIMIGCAAAVIFVTVLAYASALKNSSAIDNPLFEEAVRIIKKYETIHQPRHWPFVGYGHKVLPGEKFSRKKALSEAEAEKILRADLLKNCAQFRQYGKDSLILGVLAYNIGWGAVKRSSIIKMLKMGNRNFKDIYIAHCRYKGKVHKQIQKRRIEEFETLYIPDKKENPLEKGLTYTGPK